MRLRAVRTLVLASAAALLAALVVVVLPPAAHAATASFTKTSEWGTGYEGRFTVTNQTSQRCRWTG